MEKALRENQLGKLCFLNFLGGHWSTQNKENLPILNSLLLKIISEDISFEASNIFVKWCIRKAADEYGQTLVHQVSQLHVNNARDQSHQPSFINNIKPNSSSAHKKHLCSMPYAKKQLKVVFKILVKLTPRS